MTPDGSEAISALDLCECHSHLVLREWVAGIRALPDFRNTAPDEIENNARRCFEGFLARMRGEGDEALSAFAEGLAERRFVTGFEIHAPIDAAGRFRRGVRAAIAHVHPPNAAQILDKVEEQIDAFNLHFSTYFSERLVMASELRLRELFDNASDVFLRFDPDGLISDTNLTFERTFGRPRSEWIGRSWLDLLQPSERPRAYGALASIRDGRAVSSLPLQFVGPNGSLRLLLSGHRSDSGPHTAMIAILRDVSREETLRAQVVQAEKLASIGQLAASVAHELNNPLTWVSGNLTQALERLPDTQPDLREMLEDSLLGAERMATIVSDLRTYSRIDDHIGEFILSEVIDMAIRIAGNQLNHRARVERRYGPMPPFVGHAGRLSQVFVNLFVNAAQALASRSADENRLTISADYDGEHFLVDISDNGPGISPELLLNVFQPFVSTKGNQGTGLGLWVCKNIVEEHDGEIEVRSGAKGTTFSLRLPHRSIPLARSRPSPSKVPRAAPGLVLVVDDEEILLRVLARRLGARHEVLTARTGKAALELIERYENGIDVIICDLGMPVMSGGELYEQIEARWPDLATRVRFMSGAPEWVSSGSSATLAQRCFRKPLEVPELLEEVDTLIGRRRGESG